MSACNYLWQYIVPITIKTLFDIESIFYILAFGFSFVGLRVHSFFYGFMLIEVIIRVNLLRSVLFAIYKPREQIILTLILFLLFMYYSTLIAISLFNLEFPPEYNDTNNLLNAFFRMFDQTFKVKFIIYLTF